MSWRRFWLVMAVMFCVGFYQPLIWVSYIAVTVGGTGLMVWLFMRTARDGARRANPEAPSPKVPPAH